ncbi:MAG: hypothetical protein JNM17_38775 [Archangium sp.]|nr:hypothetical protein [Archangium sp.]
MRLLGLLLILASTTAAAQKVVVLELDGDPQGKLRAQIEQALKEAAVVEIVPLKAFKEAAAKKKLKGAGAMTAVGVKRASKLIRLDAAVGGEVADGTYKVLIYDRAGEQLWTKDLPVKKGMLSDDFAAKLARAIAAAGEQGAARNTDTTPDPQEDPNNGNTGGGGDEQPGLDLTGNDTIAKPPDPDRDTDLEDPNRRKIAPKVPVPFLRARLTGTTTWRNQCLRPGVTNCKEYDLATVPPTGISIDFTASVPYIGLNVGLELFPLALLNNGKTPGPVFAIIQGFGVIIDFLYGQSQTRIVEESQQGQGSDKTVKSDDLGFAAQIAWRYHFQMGLGLDALSGKPNTPAGQPVGYVGLRFGFQSRSFLIDPDAGTSLPSSDRVYPTGFGFPVIGLDGAVPIFPFLRFELAASLFLNPRTAPEQIVGYGNLNDPTGGATATGFGFEAGVSGQIWGPLGYIVRWRAMGFTDRYYGQGQKWTVCNEQQCGGVGEESFHTIIWGVTGQF